MLTIAQAKTERRETLLYGERVAIQVPISARTCPTVHMPADRTPIGREAPYLLHSALLPCLHSNDLQNSSQSGPRTRSQTHVSLVLSKRPAPVFLVVNRFAVKERRSRTGTGSKPGRRRLGGVWLCGIGGDCERCGFPIGEPGQSHGSEKKLRVLEPYCDLITELSLNPEHVSQSALARYSVTSYPSSTRIGRRDREAWTRPATSRV